MTAPIQSRAIVDVAGLPIGEIGGNTTVGIERNEVIIRCGTSIDNVTLAVHVTHAAALIEQIANALHLAIVPVEGLAA